MIYQYRQQMSKKLERGFYWVRTVSGWTIAELSPFYDSDGQDYSSWYLCGCETAYMTKELQEIRETPLTEPGRIPARTSVVSVFDQLGKDIHSAATIEGIKALSILKSLLKTKISGR